MKKAYIKGKLTVNKLKIVKMRKPSRDSYNEISDSLLATFPGCGHSCTSDRRLKTNIQKLGPVLKNVNKMIPVSFDWKKTSVQKRSIGLIAQDVEKIYPELVHVGEDGYRRVEYDKLTAILIAAVQELVARIEILEKKNK